MTMPARVGRAQLAQARFVGDAFAGREVGDRVRATQAFVDALGREKGRADRSGTRPVRVRLGGHVAALGLTAGHRGQAHGRCDGPRSS